MHPVRSVETTVTGRDDIVDGWERGRGMRERGRERGRERESGRERDRERER